MTDKLNNPFKISELVETVNNLVDTTYDDSVVVHKAGTETITGIKTFSGIQKLNGNTLKCFSFTKGTNPSSTQYGNFYLTDSTETSGDNTALGRFRTQVNSAGLVSTYMTSFKNATGNSSSSISIHYPVSGDPYTSAPTPATSDNSTKIATTAFVKAQGYLTSYTDTKNTAGSTNTSSKIFLIGATSQATNPQTYSQDTVFVNTSGQLQTPTPDNDSNTTVAATTAFVKNVLKTSGAGLYTISKAANGYCKFNGGLIIQWLITYNTYDATTLPIPFTSTNYAIVLSGNSADITRTKTTIQINDFNSGVSWKPDSIIGVICIGY